MNEKSAILSLARQVIHNNRKLMDYIDTLSTMNRKIMNGLYLPL